MTKYDHRSDVHVHVYGATGQELTLDISEKADQKDEDGSILT